MLKAAEVGAGEKEAPGPPAKTDSSESNFISLALQLIDFDVWCSPPVWPVIAWVGVGGGGVPPELPKLPPPAFEMLLFTGEIWRKAWIG